MRKLFASFLLAWLVSATPTVAQTARDKIGVALGSPDTTGPMGNQSKLLEALRYLGVTMVRVRAPILGTDSYRRIHTPLAIAGFKFVFTHAPDRDPVTEVAAMKALEAIMPGCVIGYEGPNEPDLNPVTFAGITDPRLGVRTGNGYAALALQRAQWSELRKVWPAKRVPMLAFNDWMHRQQSPMADLANSHIYPSGTAIAPRMAGFGHLVTAIGKPQGVITEWGYHNLIGSKRAAVGITLTQAATNYTADIPTLVNDPKVRWAFAFTLVDGYNKTSEQSNFGLFNSDWTPKPAAHAMRRALW
jgi:hypothetical protein